ncbi:MAG: carbohydrate ABC transporter permease, partial [Thermoactinomyces sp.]
MNLARKILKGAEWIGLVIVALIFLFPFAWLALTSVKSLDETTTFPPKWIPSTIHWDNFVQAWHSGPFLTYFFNSVFVAVAIVFLQFITSIPAAYAFARYRFKGDKILFGLTLVALMIPPQITFLPVFIQMSGWGLINTYVPLILPYAASAFGIFLLRQSFMQVPEEILEAARLD